MLWCFSNPPLGVYHICVTCHSRPTSPRLQQFITSPCHFPLCPSIVVGFQLHLPKRAQCSVCNPSKRSRASVSRSRRVFFFQLISVRRQKRCYSCVVSRACRLPPTHTPTQIHRLYLWTISDNWSDHVSLTINTHYLFTNKVVIIEINTK